MKNTIFALIVATGLASFAGFAKAEVIYTFDYSFNDYRGAVTGTVLGTVTSGILTPTSVTAQTGGSSFSISTSDPYSSATGGFNVIPEVISYSIYGADYITDITNETGEYWTRIWLNYSAGMNAGLNSFYSDFNGNNLNVANDWGFTGVTYSAVTVYQDPAAIPEPSTYSLIGLGALAIAIAKRKRTLAA